MGRSSSYPGSRRGWRRMRAPELHRRGRLRRDIAAALGVSNGAVSRWLTAAKDAGPEALASRMDRCGVAPRPTPEQVGLIADLLRHGAEAYGLRGAVRAPGGVAGVVLE